MRRRSALEPLLTSAPGRVGLAAFALLLLTALIVVFSYPLDFGPARWSNPAVWADYPRAVPPAWTNLWRSQRLPVHRLLAAPGPSQVSAAGPGTEVVYRYEFEQSSTTPPSFLSLTIGSVRFAARPPSYVVTLHRPDGVSLQLHRDVIIGPRPGERAPIVRHADTPLRLSLSSGAELPRTITAAFEAAFGAPSGPTALRLGPLAALFGTPDPSGTLTPLTGRYALEVRFLLASPDDEVSPPRAVVGGAVYGWLGTDALGRDLSEGLLFGLPIALLIGLLAAIFSTAIGTTLGLVGGFVGGRTDLLIQRAADIVANVPVLPLLIFLVFILGSRLWLILLILVAFSWPGLTIVMRSMVLQLRSSPEVDAARTLGASTGRIVWRHVFPHTAPYVFAQLIFFAPSAILAEAGLSFLGLGDPSLPTWGQVLEHGFRTGAVFLGYWWWVVPPGLAIVITALTFMLLSQGMERVVNPRLRRA